MDALPRPLFARSESLAERTTTPLHSHPWAQLSYAISGVLRVHTERGRFLAPPQRAILIPPGLLHEVINIKRFIYKNTSAILQSFNFVLVIIAISRNHDDGNMTSFKVLP